MGKIMGIGIDLVDVARFRRPPKNLFARLFTAGERRYCDRQAHPEIHYAARFAAKEAVLKALGTGWSGGIAWTDVDIVREEHGGATVKLSGVAAKLAKRLKIRDWHVSMTHTSTTAGAISVAQS
ncbi:MAG TPA: holo-ACP synthase [Planctomycetota bacterium]|nr:holo-ACP synthase [Planctomycetota bacterium]